MHASKHNRGLIVITCGKDQPSSADGLCELLAEFIENKQFEAKLRKGVYYPTKEDIREAIELYEEGVRHIFDMSQVSIETPLERLRKHTESIRAYQKSMGIVVEDKPVIQHRLVDTDIDDDEDDLAPVKDVIPIIDTPIVKPTVPKRKTPNFLDRMAAKSPVILEPIAETNLSIEESRKAFLEARQAILDQEAALPSLPSAPTFTPLVSPKGTPFKLTQEEINAKKRATYAVNLARRKAMDAGLKDSLKTAGIPLETILETSPTEEITEKAIKVKTPKVVKEKVDKPKVVSIRGPNGRFIKATKE